MRRTLSLPAIILASAFLSAAFGLFAPYASAGNDSDCVMLGGACQSTPCAATDSESHACTNSNNYCCVPHPVAPTAPAPNVQAAPGGGTATPKTMSNPAGKGGPVTIDNPAFKPLGDTNVQAIIGKVIKYILGMTGVVALIMVIYGGLTWMTAAGNGEKVEVAKKTIFWSVLGIIIIFSAYALVDLVIKAVS